MKKKELVEKMSSLKTTGDFRAYLMEVMVGIGKGTVDVAQASKIIKVAEQINKSMRAEIKLAEAREKRGGAPADFGAAKLPKKGGGGRRKG